MKNFTQKYLIVVVLIVISMLGFFTSVAITSNRGIGLVGHGAEYIRMASNLFDNSLLREDTLNYWQHFPPLYPLSLAMIHGAGGPDPLLAARWLNALLFGMNIFLVGLLIYRQTGVIWFAVLGSLWMLVKVDIVEIHTVAMSEPLFIFWVLLWLVFFMDFLKTRSLGSLLGFSIAAGLACSTRFAGITLILTGIVMLLFDRKRAVSNSFAAVAVFISVSLLPMILWGAKNFLDDGRFVNRSFAFHPAPIPFEQYSWPINSTHTSLMLPLIVVMVLLGWLIWEKRDRLAIENVSTHKMQFLFTTISFIVIYVLAWIITISFFDAEAYCVRYFIPLEIFNLFFCFSCVGMLLSATKCSAFLKILFCGFLSIYLIGMNLKSAAQWSVKRFVDGVDYDGKVWDDSKIIQEVKKITPHIVIYSNNVEALYVRANRQALPLTLVSKVDMISLKDNSFYGHMMERMKKDLKSKKALIVYFSIRPQNKKLPTIDELNKEIPLKMILRTSDGEIYVWNDQ